MAAFIADDLVGQLEHITTTIAIGQPFLGTKSRFTLTSQGVTVMAIVPSMTELVNAIKFALHNQVNLSLEIGSSAAVQTSLIQVCTITFKPDAQIPVLIILGAIFSKVDENAADFALIFPLICLSSCIFAGIHLVLFLILASDHLQLYFTGWEDELFYWNSADYHVCP